MILGSSFAMATDWDINSYYTFDTDGTDESGTNDLTIGAGATICSSSKVGDGALCLSASSTDYAQDTSYSGLADVRTFSYWVNQTTTTCGGNGDDMQWSVDGTGYARNIDTTHTISTSWSMSEPAISTNVWRMITVVFGGGSGSELWVDNALVSNDTETTDFSNFNRITIGNWYVSNAAYAICGQIDNFILSNTRWTEAMITEAYNSGAGMIYEPPAPIVYVDLISPANNSVNSSDNVEFKFNHTIIGDVNCSLYTNETGSWVIEETEINATANNTNTINHTLPGEGSYIWNIECNDEWAENNWTINYTIPKSVINITDYNLTSPNSIYNNNWNTDPRTNASTLDTTPTITFNTDLNTNCRMGITDINYTSMGISRQCSGGENTKNHTCTLIAGDTFGIGSQNLYASCGNYTTELTTSDSGALPILIKSIPTQPNLTFPVNNTNLVYNDSNLWTWLNWTNSTDEDNDSISYFVFVDDELVSGNVCKQNAANKSETCGASGDGSYSISSLIENSENMFDNNYSSYAHFIGDYASYLVQIYYDMPDNYLNGSIIEITSNNESKQSTNYTIPADCLDTETFKLTPYFQTFGDTELLNITCDAGVGDYRNIFVDLTNGSISVYEIVIYWKLNNTNTYYKYSFSKPDVSGQTYNWTVFANDGSYNSTNQYFYFTLVPETHLYLDGIESNRTYEYGSTAELKVNTTGTGEVCLSIYDINHGVEYLCGNNTINYNYSIENYTAIDYYNAGDKVSLYFRTNESDNIDMSLPVFLDVYSATIDLRGNNSPRYATYFDDWNKTQTTETYSFSSNVTQTFNMTFRDSNVLQSAKFTINSTAGAYGLIIDACNDGTIDVNKSQFFLTETEINFDDISTINTCINTSKEFNTVPFNITFEIGEPVTISNLLFKRSDVYKPENVYIDAGNDSLIDTALPGEIDGLVGTVNTFNDGDSSKTMTSVSDAGNTTLYNFYVPAENEITGFTIEVTASSTNGTFTESFTNLNYINSSTTTGTINTFFGQAKNAEDSSERPIESYIYSKQLPQVKTDVTQITFNWNDQEGLDGSADITYYFSGDNKENWQEITSEGSQTITNPGNDSYWYAKLTSNLQNTSYIYSVVVTGLDTLPTNFSVDIGNDGSLEYNGTTELSTSVTELDIPYSAFADYQVSPTNGLSTIPINFSYVGKGNVLLGGIEIQYSTDDISIGSGVVNAFINNIKTALSYVTSLIGGDSLNTGESTNLSINNDIIVSSAEIEILGDIYK